MTNLEQLIYTKGLENLYGSIILGEDPLNSIENLVYLTRELAVPPKTKRTVSAECSFIARICSACWPDLNLTIQTTPPELDLVRVDRFSIAAPVCDAVSQVEHRGQKPDLILLRQDGNIIRFHVEEHGQEIIEGELSND